MIEQDIIGKHEFVTFIGVVEDVADPLALGRVRCRAFGFHPENRDDVPTSDLPWAIVLQNSPSISGVGHSPNSLLPGSWVAGYFMDGKFAQYPVIWGSIPTTHLPNNGYNVGNSSMPYYGTNSNPYGGRTQGEGTESGQYPQGPQPGTPGSGAIIKDDGSYLTSANKNNWPLKIYKTTPAAGNQGLASKGYTSDEDPLIIHYASVLALESLTNEHGRSLNINSAYRTPSHNAAVGGARNSMHMKGKAFDIQLSSIGDKYQFAQLAVKNGFVGFGVYNSFMHIDTGVGRVWLGATEQRFVDALRAAGWYPGKPGLTDVRVSPGTNTANTASSNLNNRDRLPTDPTSTDPDTKAGVQQRMKDYYKSKGFTDNQVAGILGTADAESGFSTGASTIDTNGAQSFGLFQWQKTRLTGLQDYAASVGKPATDLQTQMDYSMKEFNSTHTSAYDQLKSASSPSEAARAMSNYERHAGWDNPDSVISQDRITKANEYAGGKTAEGKVKGFQDPTSSLPKGGYQGKPSTNELARGDNAGTGVQRDKISETGALTGVPIAGDIGTFGEPPDTAGPQYPYNKVYASLTGHVQEFDDTPGHERVNLEHRSGSKIEMNSGGSVVQRVKGNSYKMDFNDSYHGIMGDYMLTSVGDVRIRSTSDMVIQSDGATQEIIFNDKTTAVSGSFDIIVGETLQIKATKIIIEGVNVDIYATGKLNIHSEGDLNLKGKKVNIQSDTEINMKSETAKISSSGAMNIKGETTNVQGDTLNMKGDTANMQGDTVNIKGSDTRLTGTKISLDGITETNILKANQVQSVVIGGSGNPDAAGNAGTATEAGEAAEAASADLKKAAKRRVIQKSKTSTSHPDAVPTAEDSKANYNA